MNTQRPAPGHAGLTLAGRFEAKKHGPSSRTRATLAERFWSKVHKTEHCWIWTAGTDQQGYGRIGIGGRREPVERAHRVSWFLRHGTMPSLCVLHKCDNPPCVNPDHLFLGTRTDNAEDKVAKGRATGPTGTANARTKITADIAATVYRRVQQGEQMKIVAADIGLTPPAVRDIVRGVTWRTVTGAPNLGRRK